MEIDLIRFGVLVWLTVSAGLYDFTRRTIPNPLTVTGLAIGLGLAALAGPPRLGEHLLGAAVMLGIGVALFAGRVLGGGDVKLLTALAGLLGPSLLPELVFFTCLAGGAMAIGEAVRRGTIVPLALDVRDATASFVTVGRRGALPGRSTDTGSSLPFGIPIGVGAIVAWLV